MGRLQRAAEGGYVDHVLNRANARMTIFKKDADYEAFENVLAEAVARTQTRLLADCVMGNAPPTDAELAALRRCVNRGSPFGTQAWSERPVRSLGLESTIRPRGRPQKQNNGS